MALDLFSLVMNLRTTGVAEATAGLRSVEATGVRAAASLQSTTAAASQGSIAVTGLGARTAITAATLDRAASSAMNGKKGFKDLSAEYAHQDVLLAGMPSKTEAVRSRLASLASTAIAVTAAFAIGATIGRFLVGAAQAAVEGERATQKLRIAVNDSGFSWAAYRDRIEGTTAALTGHSIFSSTDAKNALAVLVAGTHDVARAEQLLTVAADLATFKHIGLEAAARILTQALAGNARGMKEFGIVTKDGNEAVAQLALLLRGQAAGAAETFDGKVKILKNSWNDLKEAIGGFVISTGLGDFLRNSAREFETLTGWVERLNRALGFGTTNAVADQSTGDLNARLAQLRAAARGEGPGFLRGVGLTGGVEPLTGNALAENQAEQIAIQRELVAREQKRVLEERVQTQRDKEEAEKARQEAEKAEKAAAKARQQLFERAGFGGALFGTEQVKAPATLTSSVAASSLPLRTGPIAGIDRLLNQAGTPSTPVNPEADAAAQAAFDRMERVRRIVESGVRQLRESVDREFATFGTNLADTVGNAIASAFSGKDPLKNFGRAVLAGLGSIFQQMGKAMIAASPIFIALNKAMMNPFTSGFALLGLGIALVALGATLGGIARGGGGGGGGSGDSFKDRTTNITLTAADAGGLTAPNRQVGPNIHVLGVNDPEGHRIFGQFRDNTMRRGI